MDLSVLNDRQREAVECLEGPLLVLAGAGSGKTKVLTYRIASLVEHGVKPWNILALTFTNKAAQEMRERASALIGSDADEAWVTTFHSCCVRILRIDCDKIGYERSFTIYDDADQLKIIGDILKNMGISDKAAPKRVIKENISNAKNKSLDVKRYIQENYSDDGITEKVFEQYQRRLMAANAFDFDDLLVKTIELFEQCPEVLEKYQNRFKYVLVDEYQDTNMPQYRFVEMLCRKHGNLCVVGDDDQSIYGWRGADIKNILSFEKDFEGAKVVRLEQNYRSTKYILDAANAVISHNSGRKPKTLWTAQEGGDPIERYSADNERDEAAFIARKILQGVQQGASYGDFAILYRTNAQSRVIESTLVNYGIPHKVFGGVRFYQRKEIADIMAYLRAIANPDDDVAFSRIINVPRRGIGDKTIDELAAAAEKSGQSMLVTALSGEGLPPKIEQKLKGIVDLMSELMAQSALMPLSDFAKYLVDKIEYQAYLISEDKKGDALMRMDNISELIGNIKEIERDVPEGESALSVFLESVALVSDIDSLDESEGAVALMTLHSAKGLEFPVVFMTGMEENVFPTRRARGDMSTGALEEERRLCYVGITRARQKLYLVNAQTRSIFGETTINRPSRFLEEIPQELMKDDRPKRVIPSEYERPAKPEVTYASMQGFGMKPPKRTPYSQRTEPTKPKLNVEYVPLMRIRHDKFGDGTIIDVSGTGGSMTVTVDFDIGGKKRFAAAYAPLYPITDE